MVKQVMKIMMDIIVRGLCDTLNKKKCLSIIMVGGNTFTNHLQFMAYCGCLIIAQSKQLVKVVILEVWCPSV